MSGRVSVQWSREGGSRGRSTISRRMRAKAGGRGDAAPARLFGRRLRACAWSPTDATRRGTPLKLFG